MGSRIGGGPLGPGVVEDTMHEDDHGPPGQHRSPDPTGHDGVGRNLPSPSYHAAPPSSPSLPLYGGGGGGGDDGLEVSPHGQFAVVQSQQQAQQQAQAFGAHYQQHHGQAQGHAAYPSYHHGNGAAGHSDRDSVGSSDNELGASFELDEDLDRHEDEMSLSMHRGFAHMGGVMGGEVGGMRHSDQKDGLIPGVPADASDPGGYSQELELAFQTPPRPPRQESLTQAQPGHPRPPPIAGGRSGAGTAPPGFGVRSHFSEGELRRVNSEGLGLDDVEGAAEPSLLVDPDLLRSRMRSQAVLPGSRQHTTEPTEVPPWESPGLPVAQDGEGLVGMPGLSNYMPDGDKAM